MNIFTEFGRYILMLKDMFSKPENFKMYWKEFMHQCAEIGIRSLGIVVIISVFHGCGFRLANGLSAGEPAYSQYPPSRMIVRDTVILEFAPTLVCIVLAGVVGSKIAGELGNMRVSEQIDALGNHGDQYQYLPGSPKNSGCDDHHSFAGGYFHGIGNLGWKTGQCGNRNCCGFPVRQRIAFRISFPIMFFCAGKSLYFPFIISSIPSFYGYYVKGGALEIGRASTKSVVVSCVLILLADYVLSAILL